MFFSKILMVIPLLFMMGCNMSGFGLFNTDPMVDTQKDEEGNLMLRDTPKNWDFFKQTTDMRIENEKTGKEAPGGLSWNEHWLRRIKVNEESQENPEKYITYIIESRRKAGLPELEGYSSE